MRFPLAVSGAAIIAIAAAACSGSNSTYIAPPAATTVTTGAATLGQTAVSVNAGTSSGITGYLTFSGATGTVLVTSSATAPSGTTTVVPADVKRTEATSATSPVVYYVTISSTTGATLAGLPAVSLTLPSAAIGTYQEAQYTGTAYTNVSGATASTNTAGTAVSFPQLATPITIKANGSIFLAFYQGNYPNATPTPLATPSNVLADSGFESGVAAPVGSAVTATGWTQCSITKSAAGAPAPSHAFSTFTPTPGSTPGAFIETAGTSVAVGSATPVPTQTTVPVTGGTHAAVFGGVFSNYNLEDYKYDGLCQLVTIPNNATATLNIFANGNDGKTYDDFVVDVLDTTGAYLGNLYDDGTADPITATSSGDTKYRQVSIPNSTLAPYAGQSVELFVGSWINAGSGTGATFYSTYYFVDDFLLLGTH
jgi:hypothetical protein